MTSALPWSPGFDPTAALIGDEFRPFRSLGAPDDARRNISQPNHFAIASVIPGQGFDAPIDLVHEGAPVSCQSTLAGAEACFRKESQGDFINRDGAKI